MDVPEAYTWWPEISIDAKHALEDASTRRIPEIVRREIAKITGVDVPENAELTDHDVEFIATQQEQVD